MKSLDYFQITITCLGGLAGMFLGDLSGVMTALIIFMIVDYITGVLVAISTKNLSSSIGFKGIFKKFVILLLVGIANLIDVYVVQIGGGVRLMVIIFYLSNEGISIIENATTLGLPVPDKLKSILEQIDDNEETEE